MVINLVQLSKSSIKMILILVSITFNDLCCIKYTHSLMYFDTFTFPYLYGGKSKNSKNNKINKKPCKKTNVLKYQKNPAITKI